MTCVLPDSLYESIMQYMLTPDITMLCFPSWILRHFYLKYLQNYFCVMEQGFRPCWLLVNDIIQLPVCLLSQLENRSNFLVSRSIGLLVLWLHWIDISSPLHCISTYINQASRQCDDRTLLKRSYKSGSSSKIQYTILAVIFNSHTSMISSRSSTA